MSSRFLGLIDGVESPNTEKKKKHGGRDSKHRRWGLGFPEDDGFQRIAALTYALDGSNDLTDLERKVLIAQAEAEAASMEALVPTVMWERMNKKTILTDLLKVRVEVRVVCRPPPYRMFKSSSPL